MKRLGRVLFVIVYVWATISVAGERSADAFKRIENSSRPSTRVEPASHHINVTVLPNFGHAKKASLPIVDVSLEFVSPLQVVVGQLEQPLDVECVSLDRNAVLSSRAPPSLI
jgi:hypothetical protein